MTVFVFVWVLWVCLYAYECVFLEVCVCVCVCVCVLRFMLGLFLTYSKMCLIVEQTVPSFISFFRMFSTVFIINISQGSTKMISVNALERQKS